MTDTKTPLYEGSAVVDDRTTQVASASADLETDAAAAGRVQVLDPGSLRRAAQKRSPARAGPSLPGQGRVLTRSPPSSCKSFPITARRR